MYDLERVLESLRRPRQIRVGTLEIVPPNNRTTGNSRLEIRVRYSLLEMRTVAADATAAVDALDARMLKLGTAPFCNFVGA